MNKPFYRKRTPSPRLPRAKRRRQTVSPSRPSVLFYSNKRSVVPSIEEVEKGSKPPPKKKARKTLTPPPVASSSKQQLTPAVPKAATKKAPTKKERASSPSAPKKNVIERSQSKLVPRNASLQIPSLHFPPSVEPRHKHPATFNPPEAPVLGHLPVYGGGPIIPDSALLKELTEPILTGPSPTWVSLFSF